MAGAVNNPGVYSLNSGVRIEDAIAAAGGVTAKANQSYINQTLNLAQKISDGIKIYIPEEGQTNSKEVTGVETTASSLININTAIADELDSLPGVGPVTAQNIIKNRPFSSVDELLSKKAVNDATFDKIKGLLSAY